MARLVAMYRTPEDADAFDRYYFSTHVPIAKKIPGLRKYEVSKGPVATPAGPSAFHLIAILHFDNLAAIQAAFASADGQRAAADVQIFATGGVDMIMFDSEEV
ncbi:MAG TPA: EthD family reductase [Rhizomicrobium sp.]|nr:EthD family reductase [Rhizomicrobium sp.]